MALLITVKKHYVKFINVISKVVISKVFISIVVVSLVRVLEPKCPLYNIPCCPVLGAPRDASMQI